MGNTASVSSKENGLSRCRESLDGIVVLFVSRLCAWSENRPLRKEASCSDNSVEICEPFSFTPEREMLGTRRVYAVLLIHCCQ